MATIGDQLTVPESGWKRIEESNASFIYEGSWTPVIHDGYSGGSCKYSSSVNAKATVSQKTKRLRIIGRLTNNEGYNGVVNVVVDGIVMGSFNPYKSTALPIEQAILFELTGLSDTVHTIEMVSTTAAVFLLDAIDIDNPDFVPPKIGDKLTTPEAGWKRYNDTTGEIKYVGSWSIGVAPSSASTGAYQQNIHFTSDSNAYAEFDFTGSKLRIIAQYYTNRTPSTDITVDGVKYSYKECGTTTVDQVIAFELTNLSDGRHTVRIQRTAGFSGITCIDAIDIDESGYLVGVIGQQLTAPESGWRRYDNEDPGFTYSPDLVLTSVAGSYKGTARYTGTANASTKLSFKFKGTQLRILSAISTGYSQTPIKLMIDGVEYGYTEHGSPITQQVLLFESPLLPDTVHEVSIVPPAGSPFQWDCIDINEAGYLISIIGQQLTEPEPGWRRYDNTHPSIAYKGTWTSRKNFTGTYNLTDAYTSTANSTATFGFVGTKIRIISLYYSTFTKDAKITIDGVAYTFNEYSVSDTPQVVVFEKTGLTNSYHTVEIKLNSGSAYLGIDAVDIDDTGYLTSIRGVALSSPDAGWKRYDETGVIKFNGAWSVQQNSGYYSGAVQFTTSPNSSYEFLFTGTQLRIIGRYDNTHSDVVEIEIDGIVETFSAKHPNASTSINQALLYEKTDLADTLHTVKVTNKKAISFTVDAIDIGSTSRVFHPDEVFNVKDLQTGKRIRANYKASSGIVGTISGLGKDTGDFIPPLSAAAPDGDFYFIMVDTSRKNGKMLVPDRNLQQTISWDALNLVGVASGSGIPLKIASISKMTGPNSPSVSVSASSEFNSSYQAWHAFDESSSTYWTTKAETATTEAILNITYALPQAINSYYLYAIYSPKKWVLEASHDNTQWTVLHTGNEPTTWHSGGQRTFSFVNTTAYKYYRVRVTERHEWNSYYYTGFYTVQLFSTIPDSEAILRLLTGGTISTDKDNEWDQYIVNGNGNGAYSPGDNTVWNWRGLSSATSTTSGAPGSRTTRGNTAAGAFSSTASNQGVAFRPVLVIEPLFSSSYLISDGHSVKTYKSESGWETAGSLPVTDSMFQDYGMTDLNKFAPFLKDLANTSRIEVLCCIDKDSPFPNDVTITGIPLPQIITMKDDLTFHHISHIDSITLTADQTNNGSIRLAISVDSGETWEVFDSTDNWSIVDISSDSHFKTNGMTIEQFNSISDWTSKLSTSQKLRISYCLELQSSSDIASIASLSLQVDLPNSWDKAIHGTDYHYGYTDTTNLRVRFMSDGDFKINVGSGSGTSTLSEVDGGTF